MEYSKPAESAYQLKIRGASSQLHDHICKEMNQVNLHRCRCADRNTDMGAVAGGKSAPAVTRAASLLGVCVCLGGGAALGWSLFTRGAVLCYCVCCCLSPCCCDLCCVLCCLFYCY